MSDVATACTFQSTDIQAGVEASLALAFICLILFMCIGCYVFIIRFCSCVCMCAGTSIHMCHYIFTSGSRWHSNSIHNDACARIYTCPMSTTPPESLKLTIPPKSVISHGKNKVTISGAETE